MDEAAAFTEAELIRYSRQIILKAVGGSGQRRLREARVLLVGAGALGSAAACYLAAAGVGQLVIADADQVELSNLHRQIVHTTGRIGQPKALSAGVMVQALNPLVTVTPVVERVTAANLSGLLAGVQVVVDGSDNFATRYLLNDAVAGTGVVLVSGAVLGFEGQVTVLRHGVDRERPCYRCLYPEVATEGHPTCRSAGVLGAVAGVVGSVQAAEAIKVLLSIGEVLTGRLWLFNLLDATSYRLTYGRDPCCAVHGGAQPLVEGICSAPPIFAGAWGGLSPPVG